MCKPILRHRIFQSARDVRLSNQIVERLWPIFSGENLVTHVFNLTGNGHRRKFLEMQTNVQNMAALDEAVQPITKRPRQFPSGALYQTARIYRVIMQQAAGQQAPPAQQPSSLDEIEVAAVSV